MNTGEYYSRQDEDSERIAKKRRNRLIDLSINWAVVMILSLTGFWILLTDIDTYQGEKLFFRMVNDGLTVEETESPYMADGMRRNMHYKGSSMVSFFWEKWKPRIPIYLGLVLLPLIIATVRALKYDRLQLNWFYFPLTLMGLAYFVYFWGRMRGYW